MKIECPHCKVVNEIDDELLGRTIACGHCDQVTIVPIVPVAPGVVIGKFAVRKKLRDSSFGARYLVEHLKHRQQLVLIILPDNISSTPGFVKEFGQTAELVHNLEHANVVRSAKLGHDGDIYYLPTEFVGGANLHTYLKEVGRLELTAAVNLCKSVATALDFVWTQINKVHGNVKPINVLVDKDGNAKLASTALSIYVREHGQGGIIGTPYYVSPEQLLNQPLDLRSDIYSLGATFYHVLAGRPPFEGRDPERIAHARLTSDAAPVTQFAPEVTPKMASVVERMMTRSLGDRYQDYESLLADLG
ncbi:MAG: serine/threonine protein kinase [Rhodothermales bacterium]|jgi:serine/threonine protein kinase